MPALKVEISGFLGGSKQTIAAASDTSKRAIRAPSGVGSLVRPYRETSALARCKLAIESAKPAKPKEPIAAAQARLLALVDRGQVEAIARRDLRRTGEAIWDGPQPLGARPEALKALLAEIGRRSLRGAVREAIGAYIVRFTPDLPALGVLAGWLDREARLHEWPWRERAARLNFFDPVRAPRVIGQRILSQGEPLDRAFAGCGLEPPRDLSGLAAAAFRAACERMAGQGGSPDLVPDQERLMAWAAAPDAKSAAALRFRHLWDDLALALFVPWETSEPPKAHKSRLSEFAIDVAGDPRLSDRMWGAASSRGKRVLERWLTQAAFKAFFEFIDATALDRHWSYRKAFWRSYLDANHVSAAWAVLGPKACEVARRKVATLKDRSLLQFGRVRRSTGKASDQSALIMRIGDAVAVDWSHNGKWHLWKASSRALPRIFAPEYDAFALQSDYRSGSHIGSDRYYWQHELADEIRELTGIRVDERRWKPS